MSQTVTPFNYDAWARQWIRAGSWEPSLFGVIRSSFDGPYGSGLLMHELLHKQMVGGGFTHDQMFSALGAVGLSPQDRTMGRSPISDLIGRICF